MFDVISPYLKPRGVQTVQVKSVNKKCAWNFLALVLAGHPHVPLYIIYLLVILCMTKVDFSSSSTQVFRLC